MGGAQLRVEQVREQRRLGYDSIVLAAATLGTAGRERVSGPVRE